MDNLVPHVNDEGKEVAQQFSVGLDELKKCVHSGDIRCQSNLFENLGVPGLRKLAGTVPSPLKEKINELADRDVVVVNQLNALPLGNKERALTIVCGILILKANEINSGVITTFATNTAPPLINVELLKGLRVF